MASNSPLPYYPTAEAAKVKEADIFLYGNINLLLRVPNPEKPKQLETLKSISIERKVMIGDRIRKVQVGIPTLNTDGKQLTDAQAEVLFQQTGSHLGFFADVKTATKYLIKLSEASGYVQKTILAAERVGVNDEGLSTFDFLPFPFLTYQSGLDPAGKLAKATINQPKRLGELISIPEIPPTSEAAISIADRLTSISVSYDIGATTEVSLKFVDKDFLLMESNYFVPRRVIKYRGREYEVAVIEVESESGIPVLNVKLRSRAVQRMKREKTAKNLQAPNGYELAKKSAATFGLSFYGQQKTDKPQTIVQAQTKDNDDSLWDVLTRTAADANFICFEMDGTLIYASERYLMGAFGAYSFGTDEDTGEAFTLIGSKSLTNSKNFIPLCYVPPYMMADLKVQKSDIPDCIDRFRLIENPSFRHSDNDVFEADGSCSIARPNGCLLRPGHTVLVGPFPTFFAGLYLVNSVSFNEGENTPVEVSFKSPQRTEKDKKNKPLVGIRPGTRSFARFRDSK